MKPRLQAALTILSLAAAATTGAARAEVYAELDPNGVVIGAHVPPGRTLQPHRVWETTGAAESRSHVLNPEGAMRGDGRPAIAISPATGMPRAVWARREGGHFDIATSSFDGRAWSAPTLIHPPNDVDDVDPEIVIRSDGVVIVSWWQTGPAPAVRMSYSPSEGRWRDAGVISAPGEKAKRPAVRQEGSLTIVAYRTPRDIKIVTFTIVASSFGDGPTPFPRSGGDPKNTDGPVPLDP